VVASKRLQKGENWWHRIKPLTKKPKRQINEVSPEGCCQTKSLALSLISLEISPEARWLFSVTIRNTSVDISADPSNPA
jgi:hypothetical protein